MVNVCAREWEIRHLFITTSKRLATANKWVLIRFISRYLGATILDKDFAEKVGCVLQKLLGYHIAKTVARLC
jgi:hypothetical protein